MKLYYRSAAEAHQDGYTNLDLDSLSKSGRVNPFSGLRGEAKQLFKEIAAGREQRVQLVSVPPQASGKQIGQGRWWSSVLEDAEVVVLATGLQTNQVPVVHSDGSAFEFQVDAQVILVYMFSMDGVCLCCVVVLRSHFDTVVLG